MSRRRIRIPQLLAAAAILGAVMAGGMLVGIVASVLAGPALGNVQTAVLLTVVALGVAAVFAAVMVGRAVSRGLGDARAAVLARARGETAPPPGSAWLTEIDDINAAIERLFARIEQREADSERESVERGVLLDAVSEGILQLDAGGRVVRANPAANALLGLADADGAPISTRVRNAELRRLLEQAARGEAVAATEITLDDRRLLISAHPLTGRHDDGSAGAVVAFVDLTELRRLEGVRRDFVANVSHELKTPLTSIRGYVETLLTDEELTADMRRQFLDVVHKNAERLHRIVDDLLDLSRLQSGGWRPELHAVDARAVIDDVWSHCHERAQRCGVSFVPPQDTHVAVLADPGGLRQVLSNLFDNALRYTPPGGRIEVSCGITPTTAQRNGRAHDGGADHALVTFEVRDNGTGIPSDALPRIFERFYRVDPARSRAEGGTGLGLSIVKHLVESMGGDVSAESELGKGTTIRFRLPAAA